MPSRERDRQCRLEECGSSDKQDSAIQYQHSEEDRQSPHSESPYRDTAVVQCIARESHHGEIASVQQIARNSTAHKQDSVWHSGVRVNTAEQRWIASVLWDCIVWF